LFGWLGSWAMARNRCAAGWPRPRSTPGRGWGCRLPDQGGPWVRQQVMQVTMSRVGLCDTGWVGLCGTGWVRPERTREEFSSQTPQATRRWPTPLPLPEALGGPLRPDWSGSRPSPCSQLVGQCSRLAPLRTPHSCCIPPLVCYSWGWSKAKAEEGAQSGSSILGASYVRVEVNPAVALTIARRDS